jgi:hypothetical protein
MQNNRETLTGTEFGKDNRVLRLDYMLVARDRKTHKTNSGSLVYL